VGGKGASFKSLHDCWADTTTPHGRLMLTILGGLAEFERTLIKARTDVGIKRAREQGIRFGRPPKLTKHQQTEALRLLDEGEPQAAVARLLGVDQSTISRLAARVAAYASRKRMVKTCSTTCSRRQRGRAILIATKSYWCVRLTRSPGCAPLRSL